MTARRTAPATAPARHGVADAPAAAVRAGFPGPAAFKVLLTDPTVIAPRFADEPQRPGPGLWQSLRSPSESARAVLQARPLPVAPTSIWKVALHDIIHDIISH